MATKKFSSSRRRVSIFSTVAFILTCLIARPTFAQFSAEVDRQIGLANVAKNALTECLRNHNIDYNGDCDDAKIQPKLDEISAKIGTVNQTGVGGPQIALSDRIELAKLSCLSFATCVSGKCICAPGCRGKDQVHSETCEKENTDFERAANSLEIELAKNSANNQQRMTTKSCVAIRLFAIAILTMAAAGRVY